MAYNNTIRSKEDAKLVAYLLNKEFGASQKNIACVFNTSQSAISNWIKEVDYQRQIYDLSNEISRLKNQVENISNQLNLKRDMFLVESISS
ncbi:hypothetical protein [Pasteurella atlantica]|uniref:hypothetical protein n=1 Tax=Pasteurellaceae TaxID=712 RepID=UPI0027591355|nr:hypothetical protein [Pasteurella atlantica]MDP8099442.1 hypothetical protein [Pasteurella atlantica]MDP8107330.1 hypothetical protein [Pasteurella atlantica]MDP8117022.1 hypothetical protein [Pasteurella atlantica]